MINLSSAATSTRQHAFQTTELANSLMHKSSPERMTTNSLGVDQRYSVMDNYADFLAGKPLDSHSSSPELVMAEANTPHVAPPLRDEYYGFRELLRLRKERKLDEAQFEQKRLDTTFVIQSIVFGDGAVALLVGSEEGKPAFGPISHLTNDEPDDVNSLTMTSNSSHPFLQGHPQYHMRPGVPTRGAHYAVTTIKNVLNHPDSPDSTIGQIDDCLIHTGSKKILDGVCSQLHLQTDSMKVQGSYDVLKNYGNAASTEFMMAEKEEWNGPTMVVGFGVGLTASAGVMSLN